MGAHQNQFTIENKKQVKIIIIMLFFFSSSRVPVITFSHSRHILLKWSKQLLYLYNTRVGPIQNVLQLKYGPLLF
jgi:hypothetical protein